MHATTGVGPGMKLVASGIIRSPSAGATIKEIPTYFTRKNRG